MQSETVDLKTRNLPNDVTMGFYNHVLMWTGESITWSVSEVEYMKVSDSNTSHVGLKDSRWKRLK